MQETEKTPVTLVVLGSGFKENLHSLPPEEMVEIRQPSYLSLTSKIRTLAAIERLKRGDARIIFSGGHTAGEDWLSEAEGMKDYSVAHSKGDIKNALEDALPENKSKDTSGNAENISPLVKGAESVEVLTSILHLPRATRLFRNYGIPAKGVPAEYYLWQRSKHHRRFLIKYFLSASTIKSVIIETALNALLLFDPKGLKLRKYTQNRGKHQLI